jgi:hypothetical protein
MTAQTLSRDATRMVAFQSSVQLDAPGVRKYTKAAAGGKTTLVLENVPVFRSGTFADSMGYEHTYDDTHMSAMVANFDHLRAQKILEDIPVRAGHNSLFGQPLDGVIGYHTGLRTEVRTNPVSGTDETYLLADYEILDPDAQSKIDSGLWRNLSSEVGYWSTNDKREFWPVYQGVAYVDFSAVEGLRFSKSQPVSPDGHEFSILTEGATMPEATNSAPTPGVEPVEPVVEPVATPPVPAPAEPVAPVVPAEDEQDENEQPPAAPPVADPPAPADDFARSGGVIAFRINGEDTRDFASVQAHITSLENFRRESEREAVTNFVNGLATEGKILASAIPALQEFASSLSADQFSAWSKTQEALPKASLLGEFGVSNTAPADVQTAGEGAEKYAAAKETVRQFQLGKRTQEWIEKTGAYKIVAAYEANQNK